jgi:hypothetical protein
MTSTKQESVSNLVHSEGKATRRYAHMQDEEGGAAAVKPSRRTSDASTVATSEGSTAYSGVAARNRFRMWVCLGLSLLVIGISSIVILAKTLNRDEGQVSNGYDYGGNTMPTPSTPSRVRAPTMAVPYVPTSAPATSVPTASMAPTIEMDDDEINCGCSACTKAVWQNVSGTPERTCGQRVKWLMNTFPLEYSQQQDACRRVAFEFPCECGGCDPSRCDVRVEPFVAKEKWELPHQPVAPYKMKFPSSMYCFPPAPTTWRMWNGKQIQVKEDASVCGPGNNLFSNETAYEKDGELYLTYSNQQASEVRVTLPGKQIYGYGTYTFSVKSISVLDAAGRVKDNKLPKDLVLGIFTWDDTDNYAIHENFNHEVDIEISRWNCDDNSDVQFLVQPAGFPQMYRFYSGQGATYDQGGHTYSFTWLPNRIDWATTAGGGQQFSLTTEEALYKKVPDFVQCMPSGYTEVRLNLWNVNGAEVPAGLEPTDTVQVVIDKFEYESSPVAYAADGDYCSKSCQCGPASECLNGLCTNLYAIAH